MRNTAAAVTQSSRTQLVGNNSGTRPADHKRAEWTLIIGRRPAAPRPRPGRRHSGLFICQVLTAVELGYNLRFYQRSTPHGGSGAPAAAAVRRDALASQPPFDRWALLPG